MTSSRFPIGVAQTARGTTRRLERDQSGADQPRRFTELRALDLEVTATVTEHLAQYGPARGRKELIERSDAEAAADRHALEPEDVDERPDRDAEVVPDRLERRVVLLDQVVRGRLGTDQFLRGARRGRAGAVRLDVAAPGARALARHAVGDDHHVPELGPRMEELPAEHDPAPHPGPERQRAEIGGATPCTVHMLRKSCTARVVLHTDRQPEPVRHLGEEIDLAQRDVDRAEGDGPCGSRTATGCRSRPRRRRRAVARVPRPQDRRTAPSARTSASDAPRSARRGRPRSLRPGSWSRRGRRR